MLETTAQLVLGVLFYLFAVVIHEFGHLLAARLVGWKPINLVFSHGRAGPTPEKTSKVREVKTSLFRIAERVSVLEQAAVHCVD
jgi:hypothetical protein